MRHKEYAFPMLHAWMVQKNMTLARFANAIGMSEANACYFMKGKRQLRKNNIDKILRATGMTYEEAFGDPRKEHD